ncbi:MAG: hypothetical protein Q7J16_02560 [Candidatus Cloacimonadales bacterium]|nr:hypothetical protein [Candidatus Cloacimonadales bacterium]
MNIIASPQPSPREREKFNNIGSCFPSPLEKVFDHSTVVQTDEATK